MADVVETEHLVAILGGAAKPTDAALAALRAATVGEQAAATLDSISDFVLVQQLGPLVRAQLRGAALTLSVERRDGILAVFGAPDSERWSTVVETDVSSVGVVDAKTGATIWSSAPSESVSVPPGTSLHFSNGRTVAVDRTMLIGRSPRVERVTSSELPALVPIDSDNAAVSRTHLKISVRGDRSVIEDLDSTNGTAVAPLGGVPHALAPGELAELVDGMVVTIAERVAFRVVLS